MKGGIEHILLQYIILKKKSFERNKNGRYKKQIKTVKDTFTILGQDVQKKNPLFLLFNKRESTNFLEEIQ